MDLKEKNKLKIARFKERLNKKDRELNVLLEITNAINSKQSTLDIVEKFENFIKNELKIERAVLFAKYKRWMCLLDYNVEGQVLDSLEVDRDLMHIKDITSVNSLENKIFKDFDMVVPVYHGDKALAYLILGDVDEEAVGVSSIIKHLNFLQLLTNIIVSAIENQRLAKEAIKQEREKQKLIEKQKEMLEIQVEERTSELREERDESERLLHNILPLQIANELKHKGYTTAKSYQEATILFTDFKGFTETSAKITARKLVGELNDIFKGFDHIMGQYGVEKIKTIGDAYMAVCGLPVENKNHALVAVRAAQSMLDFLEKRGKKADIKWRMRVGLHSGPLIAGVVGAKKFTFDVWGDTVNTGARMESGGEPGKINISQNTYELVKDYFKCEHRGKILAKGKGEVDMYFVKEEISSSNLKGKAKNKGVMVGKVKAFVEKMLKKELPDNLHYHGLHHTLAMFESAVEIAKMEKVRGEELKLIKVAALLHDSGFTRTYNDHEEAGCDIAMEFLPDFGFNKEQIDRICAMIMVTKMPQSPNNLLEQIICDADLDYLGTHRFGEIGATLFQELNAMGHGLDEKKWNNIQLDFLLNHKYHTASCKKLREPVKQEHIKQLKTIIQSY